jgi:hypothetical protein
MQASRGPRGEGVPTGLYSHLCHDLYTLLDILLAAFLVHSCTVKIEAVCASEVYTGLQAFKY